MRAQGGVTLTYSYEDDKKIKNDTRKSVTLSQNSGGHYNNSFANGKQSKSPFNQDQNELSIFSQEPTDFDYK